MEILTIVFGLLTGYLATFLYEHSHLIAKNKTKKELILRIKGWHLHHSLYSLILLIIAYFATSVFILGTALGVKIRHIHSEKKFTFIDRS
jgi:hypothetical protein